MSRPDHEISQAAQADMNAGEKDAANKVPAPVESPVSLRNSAGRKNLPHQNVGTDNDNLPKRPEPTFDDDVPWVPVPHLTSGLPGVTTKPKEQSQQKEAAAHDQAHTDDPQRPADARTNRVSLPNSNRATTQAGRRSKASTSVASPTPMEPSDGDRTLPSEGVQSDHADTDIAPAARTNMPRATTASAALRPPSHQPSEEIEISAEVQNAAQPATESPTSARTQPAEQVEIVAIESAHTDSAAAARSPDEPAAEPIAARTPIRKPGAAKTTATVAPPAPMDPVHAADLLTASAEPTVVIETDAEKTPYRLEGELERQNPDIKPLNPTRIDKAARDRLLSWGVPEEYIEHLQELTSSFRYDLVDQKIERIAHQKGYVNINSQGMEEIVIPDFYDRQDRLDGECGDLSRQQLYLLHQTGFLRDLNDILSKNGMPKINPVLIAGYSRTHFTYEMDANLQGSHHFMGLLPQGESPEKMIMVDASFQEISPMDTNEYKVKKTHINPSEITERTAGAIPVGTALIDTDSVTVLETINPLVVGISQDRQLIYKIAFLKDRKGIYHHVVAAQPNEKKMPFCVGNIEGVDNGLLFQRDGSLTNEQRQEMTAIAKNFAQMEIVSDPEKTARAKAKKVTVKFESPPSISAKEGEVPTESPAAASPWWELVQQNRQTDTTPYIVGFYQEPDGRMRTLYGQRTFTSQRQVNAERSEKRQVHLLSTRFQQVENPSMQKSDYWNLLPEDLRAHFERGEILVTGGNDAYAVSEEKSNELTTSDNPQELREHIQTTVQALPDEYQLLYYSDGANNGRTGVLMRKDNDELKPVTVEIDGKEFVIEVKGCGTKKGGFGGFHKRTGNTTIDITGGAYGEQAEYEFSNLLKNTGTDLPQAAGSIYFDNDGYEQGYIIRLTPSTVRASYSRNEAYPSIDSPENVQRILAMYTSELAEHIFAPDPNIVDRSSHTENILIWGKGRYTFTDFSDHTPFNDFQIPNEERDKGYMTPKEILSIYIRTVSEIPGFDEARDRQTFNHLLEEAFRGHGKEIRLDPEDDHEQVAESIWEDGGMAYQVFKARQAGNYLARGTLEDFDNRLSINQNDLFLDSEQIFTKKFQIAMQAMPAALTEIRTRMTTDEGKFVMDMAIELFSEGKLLTDDLIMNAAFQKMNEVINENDGDQKIRNAFLYTRILTHALAPLGNYLFHEDDVLSAAEISSPESDQANLSRAHQELQERRDHLVSTVTNPQALYQLLTDPDVSRKMVELDFYTQNAHIDSSDRTEATPAADRMEAEVSTPIVKDKDKPVGEQLRDIISTLDSDNNPYLEDVKEFANTLLDRAKSPSEYISLKPLSVDDIGGILGEYAATAGKNELADRIFSLLSPSQKWLLYATAYTTGKIDQNQLDNWRFDLDMKEDTSESTTDPFIKAARLLALSEIELHNYQQPDIEHSDKRQSVYRAIKYEMEFNAILSQKKYRIDPVRRQNYSDRLMLAFAKAGLWNQVEDIALDPEKGRDCKIISKALAGKLERADLKRLTEKGPSTDAILNWINDQSNNVVSEIPVIERTGRTGLPPAASALLEAVAPELVTQIKNWNDIDIMSKFNLLLASGNTHKIISYYKDIKKAINENSLSMALILAHDHEKKQAEAKRAAGIETEQINIAINLLQGEAPNKFLTDAAGFAQQFLRNADSLDDSKKRGREVETLAFILGEHAVKTGNRELADHIFSLLRPIHKWMLYATAHQHAHFPDQLEQWRYELDTSKDTSEKTSDPNVIATRLVTLTEVALQNYMTAQEQHQQTLSIALQHVQAYKNLLQQPDADAISDYNKTVFSTRLETAFAKAGLWEQAANFSMATNGEKTWHKLTIQALAGKLGDKDFVLLTRKRNTGAVLQYIDALRSGNTNKKQTFKGIKIERQVLLSLEELDPKIVGELGLTPSSDFSRLKIQLESGDFESAEATYHTFVRQNTDTDVLMAALMLYEHKTNLAATAPAHELFNDAFVTEITPVRKYIEQCLARGEEPNKDSVRESLDHAYKLFFVDKDTKLQDPKKILLAAAQLYQLYRLAEIDSNQDAIRLQNEMRNQWTAFELREGSTEDLIQIRDVLESGRMGYHFVKRWKVSGDNRNRDIRYVGYEPILPPANNSQLRMFTEGTAIHKISDVHNWIQAAQELNKLHGEKRYDVDVQPESTYSRLKIKGTWQLYGSITELEEAVGLVARNQPLVITTPEITERLAVVMEGHVYTPETDPPTPTTEAETKAESKIQHPQRQVRYEEVPEGQLSANTLTISDISPDMDPVEAIEKFQRTTYERLQKEIGILDHGIPVEELRAEFEKFGIPFAPVIVAPFDELIAYLDTHEEYQDLRAILSEYQSENGAFLFDYNIGFVDTLDQKMREKIHTAGHESGGHGGQYNVIRYHRNQQNNTLRFEATRLAVEIGGLPRKKKSYLEETIVEWRSQLISEKIVNRYAPVNYPKIFTAEIANSSQSTTVAVPSRYNESDGEPGICALLTTIVDVLVASDSEHPDRELFKAFLYGNTSPEAYLDLKAKLDLIDPNINIMLKTALKPVDEYSFYGEDLALYIQDKLGKWTPEAVERAAAVTRRLLEEMHSELTVAGAETMYSSTDIDVHSVNLSSVLGHFSDGVHGLGSFSIENNMLIYKKRAIDVTNLEDEIAPEKLMYSETNRRVIDKAREVCPHIQKVFAPFNGAETTNLEAEYTIATDRLPIGTPQQVEQLYRNQFARAMYLADKLDRGHSYSGVLQEIGYLGAALQWDIEDIQGGKIIGIHYLNGNGKELDRKTLVENSISPTGIKIIYQTPDGRTRVHEQYSGIPDRVQSQLIDGKFDALYLRATESLVTKREFFPEYQLYLAGVKPGGVVVSDSKKEHLTRNMDGTFSQEEIVELEDHEDFGYAGKSAKITAKRPDLAFQGYVVILKIARAVPAAYQREGEVIGETVTSATDAFRQLLAGIPEPQNFPPFPMTDTEIPKEVKIQLEQHRFLITPESRESMIKLWDKFQELQQRYSHLEGLGIFGSKKTGTERPRTDDEPSDFDIVIFFDSSKLQTAEERLQYATAAQWLNITDPLEQTLDGLELDYGLEKIIDISQESTQRDLETFLEIAKPLINKNITEETIPYIVNDASVDNLMYRFLLAGGEAVIKSRKDILNYFRGIPDGEKYFQILMTVLSDVDRPTDDRGPEKVNLPRFPGLPKTLDEAEAYFVTDRSEEENALEMETDTIPTYHVTEKKPGGTSNVYKVDIDDESFALKTAKPGEDIDLERGYEIQSSVRHPYILPALGFETVVLDTAAISSDENNGDPVEVIRFKFIEHTLQDKLSELTDTQLSKILRQQFSAMQYLSVNDIDHGDLKAESILLEDGDSFLTDFSHAHRITKTDKNSAATSNTYNFAKMLKDIGHERSIQSFAQIDYASGLITNELLEQTLAQFESMQGQTEQLSSKAIAEVVYTILPNPPVERLERDELVDSPNTQLLYFERVDPNAPVKRDRFGNRVVVSPDLNYKEKDGSETRAAMLISREGENFIRANPGILHDIERGLNTIGKIDEDTWDFIEEVELGEGRKMRMIPDGGKGTQSTAFLLEINGEKYVIKERKYGSDTAQPYIREMLQTQEVVEELSAELAQLGIDELSTFLFASGQVSCTKFIEGKEPTERQYKKFGMSAHLLLRNFIMDNQHRLLWKNIYPDALVRKNFLLKPNKKFGWHDIFMNDFQVK